MELHLLRFLTGGLDIGVTGDVFSVGGELLLTSTYSVGRNLPKASSSPPLLLDSGPYNPAQDLYHPDTVRTKTG